jgi:lipopolysaccharide assembly protein A
MRWLYVALIVLFTAVVLLFKVQNIDTVTVSLFTLSVTMPLALLLVGVYVLGMFSGSFLAQLLRGWWRKARAPDRPALR